MNTTPQTNITTAEPAAETLPAVATKRAPLMVGGRVQAIVPQSVEEAYRLAGAIVSADMAPKSYKRDQNAVMVGILHGMEVGFTPMAALQSIAVINGMPSIWGDGALALVEASGLLEDKKEWFDGEGDALTYHCHMKRRHRPTWIEQQFSWGDAKIAKLIGKDTYQQYGRRMLQRRARAWAMTDGFSDVLRGLHIREIVDMAMNDEGVYEDRQIPNRPTRSSVLTSQPVPDEDVAAAERAMDAEYRATMNGTMPDDVDAGEVEPEVDESEPTAEELNPTYDFPAVRKEIEGKLLKAGSPKAIDGIAVSYEVQLTAMKAQQPDMARELSATFSARRKKLEG